MDDKLRERDEKRPEGLGEILRYYHIIIVIAVEKCNAIFSSTSCVLTILILYCANK